MKRETKRHVKAPTVEQSKMTLYYNIGSFPIVQPRGFDMPFRLTFHALGPIRATVAALLPQLV